MRSFFSSRSVEDIFRSLPLQKTPPSFHQLENTFYSTWRDTAGTVSTAMKLNALGKQQRSGRHTL